MRKGQDEAEIFQPIPFFQTLSKSPAMLLKHVQMRAERLAESHGMAASGFREWFSGMLGNAGKAYLPAFYGKSVYGDKGEVPSDLDVIYFILDEKKLSEDRSLWQYIHYPGRPRFVHGIEVYQNDNPVDNLSGWKRFLVAGTMLVAPSVHPDFRSAVEKARAELLEDDFFVGGFGDILTYAVWKVLSGKEYQHLEPGNRSLLDRGFFVPHDACDSGATPPVQFKVDVRRQLAEDFSESEMRTLARAAARRIKIKASYRDQLAERFVRNMRPLIQR
ncbi:MAG: hypothetical protein AB1295_05025 [Candidatus Micrarchaeota archaeon]